jgi:hypothetical protein
MPKKYNRKGAKTLNETLKIYFENLAPSRLSGEKNILLKI